MTETKEVVEVPFIEGNIINLCPITADHFKLYCNWMNSPECRISGGYQFPQTVEEIKKFFEPKDERIKGEIYFEIWQKKDKKPIGLTGFSRINYFSHSGYIFNLIGEQILQNGDVAIESIKLILNYGFKELNLNKISYTVSALNKLSIKVAEKVGLKHELTLKNEGYFKGQRVDLLKYFLLKKDWMKNVE